ncbi:DUF5117 domain-containing protein [Algoriphagus sp. E1-3-M2]|nr:DUF5117 domain-containing protein [Algoriphagus sp. E1-3-M2]MEB2786145.1 DUF5117 domain-containing protein [Algoriphagus sp. E1-3-M2]
MRKQNLLRKAAQQSLPIKSPFKKYSEIVTGEAVSDQRLFTVHKVGDKSYYEVPFDLLGTDMLLVSRISKIGDGLGGGYTTAGSKSNEQVIHWSRIQNSIILRSISFDNVAADSFPIFLSVEANNYNPILATFKIEAFNSDSTATLIEVNELFLSDIPALSGLSSSMRKQYQVRNLDRERSFITRMASYPENIEVRHDIQCFCPPFEFTNRYNFHGNESVHVFASQAAYAAKIT